MKTISIASKVLALVITTICASAQTTVSVPGNANIYGAGFTTVPNPTGSDGHADGGGVLPTSYALPGGTTIVTFTNVTGTTRFDYVNYSGVNIPADGGTAFGGQTAVSSYNSLPGITHTQRTGFLVGVFLDASEPSGTAPETLSYDTTAAGASSFSPSLKQVFFVGDGLDASSATQTFHVPSGATRLFLGFADAWNGTSLTGLPGYYHDNDGSLSVTISAVPEPSVYAVLTGLGALVVAMWRTTRFRRSA